MDNLKVESMKSEADAVNAEATPQENAVKDSTGKHDIGDAFKTRLHMVTA